MLRRVLRSRVRSRGGLRKGGRLWAAVADIAMRAHAYGAIQCNDIEEAADDDRLDSRLSGDPPMASTTSCGAIWRRTNPCGSYRTRTALGQDPVDPRDPRRDGRGGAADARGVSGLRTCSKCPTSASSTSASSTSASSTSACSTAASRSVLCHPEHPRRGWRHLLLWLPATSRSLPRLRGGRPWASPSFGMTVFPDPRF